MGRVLDLLAWNAAASALFGGLEARQPRALNIARLVFLDPAFRRLLGPEQAGTDVVGALRLAQGQSGSDPDLDALIDELRDGSSDFRQIWEARNVAAKSHGRKTFVHPQVGRLDLEWERLTVPEGDGQALMVYGAQAGTPSATALALLNSVAATDSSGTHLQGGEEVAGWPTSFCRRQIAAHRSPTCAVTMSRCVRRAWRT